MGAELNNNISLADCLSMVSFDVPENQRIILSFITSVFSLPTIGSNVLLIYSLYKTRLYKTITNKFVIAMNISDLLTGILVLPLLLAHFLTNMKNVHCFATPVTTGIVYSLQYFGYTLSYFSGFMLLTIAGDRYLHITRLLLYKSYMNHFKMKTIITASFLLSNIVALFMHFIPSFYLLLVLSLANILLMTVAYFFYYSLLRRIHNHAASSKITMNAAQKLDISMAKTVKLLIGVISIIYMPYTVTSNIRAYYIYEERTNPGLYWDLAVLWSYMIVFSNAIVNSVLYGYTNKIVKAFILKRFKTSRVQVQET